VTAKTVAVDPLPTEEPAIPAIETDSPTTELSTDPLACLNLRQKLGQTLMPLVVQSELAGLSGMIESGEIGGLTLLGTLDQSLPELIDNLQAASEIPLHIASDEEGGSVQRLGALIHYLPSARDQASSNTPAELQVMFSDYGRSMAELGITMAFAPVVDVGGGPGIGDRSYSSDPQVVIEYAAAVSAGFEEAGVVPILKHFPGHGRASADSHNVLPTTPPLASLRESDLVPYEALLASAHGVMVAHLSVPDLSDETPTSLSPNTIDGLLRTDFEFHRLVITDALNMGAITSIYSVQDAALLALQAGADIAMINGINDVTPVLDHLEQAVETGELSNDVLDAAVLRILESKDEPDHCSR